MRNKVVFVFPLITLLHYSTIISTQHVRNKRGVPSLPDYFERRVKPRIHGGVGLVKTAGGVVRERVMPAILDTALTLGNAGVTAVSQLHRAAQPVVSESAAHFKHSYDEHIAPGVAASVSTLGQGAKDGYDRMSVALLGHETHNRMAETMGAVGTIARYLTGINGSIEDTSRGETYKDYGGLHGPLYTSDTYSDYTEQLVYQPTGELYYDYPYQTGQNDYSDYSPDYSSYPYSNNGLYTENFNYDLQGRSIMSPDYEGQGHLDVGLVDGGYVDQPPAVDREGFAQKEEAQTVEEALYIIGKNLLGANVTNRLLPMVETISHGVGLVNRGLNSLGGAITRGRRDDNDGRVVNPAPSCTTPSGGRGSCRDIQACPLLLADLNALRGSICFKSLFAPGVCCPEQGVEEILEDFNSVASYPSPTPPSLPSIAELPPPVLSQGSPTASQLNSNYVPGSNQRCGGVKVPQGRIVGGNETYEGEVPWMAAIYLHGAGRREFWCGGALVTDRHVITAAHCTKDKNKKSFSPSQFTVRVGEWDLGDADEYSIELAVSKFQAHPNFRPNGFYNDIAVFTLEKAVPFTQYIQPICLPTGHFSDQLFTNQLPTALGWGTTYYDGQEVPRLRGVPLPVWTNEDCDKAYFQPITEVFLCAGYADGGRDACQGDSGGPLMLYQEDTQSWMLIGVVSFGNRCAESGYPGVYTRVNNFIDWVLDEINS